MNVAIPSAKERYKPRDNLGGARTTRCLKPFILVNPIIVCIPYIVFSCVIRRPERSADVPPRKFLADSSSLLSGESLGREGLNASSAKSEKSFRLSEEPYCLLERGCQKRFVIVDGARG